MTSSFKLNHNFQHNNDPRNYVYDCLENKKAQNQPSGTIKNSLHITKISPSIQLIALSGTLNQGNLGSCAQNALAVAISIASTGKINDLCRLYNYFITQSLDNSNPLQDNGSTTQSLIQSLKKYRCCSEKYFPYLPLNYLKIPPITCFQNTYPLKQVVYSYISQDVNMWTNIQNSILNTNNKVSGNISGMTLGIRVYSSFMNSQVATTGIVPMPNVNTEKLLGGHCLAIVGYTTINTINYVIFQNSWGTGWGNKGCGYIPIDYLRNPSLSEKPLLINIGY